MKDREKIIRYFAATSDDAKDMAIRLLDLADVVDRGRPFAVGPFMSPFAAQIGQTIATHMKTVTVKSEGGYHEAERVRIAFSRDDYDGPIDFGMTLLSVTWDDRYRLIGHRDVLGSLMGLGIDRAVLGDILMQGAGCQIVADSTMAGWIRDNFHKVAMVPVTVKEIPMEEIEPPKKTAKEVRATVASLRLDAVGAAGFGISRSKMVQAVEPLITAFFDKVASLAEKIGPPLEKVFGAVADKIGKIDFSGLSNSLGSLSGPIAAVTGLLGAAGLGGALKGLSGVPLIGDMLSKFGGVLTGLGGPITLVIGALAGLIATSPQLRAQFGDVLTNVFNSLKQAFQTLQPSIKTLMGAFGQLVQALIPVLAEIIPLLTPIISTLIGSLVPAIQIVLNMVTGLVNGLMPIVRNILPAVAGALKYFLPLVQAIIPIISWVVVALTTGLGVFKAVITAISLASKAQAVLNAVLNANPFILVVSLVASLVSALVYFFTCTDKGKALWQQFTDFLSNCVQNIRDFFSGLGNDITGFFTAAGQGVQNVWNGVVSWFTGIPNAICGVFAGAGAWLWNAGASIINGLLNGLKAAFGRVKSFVSGIGDWIVRHKGPLSYDKVMLKPAGLAIMQGFDKSLKAGWKDVQRTVNGMNAQINGGFDVDASKTGRANVSNGGGSTTYVQQTFNYPAIAPTSISTQQKLQTAAMPQW